MALYNEGMWELFSQYGSQDRNSWLVLRTAGKRVFNASLVKEPAVILLAGDSLTATCFAKELAEVALTALKGNPMAVDSTIIDGTSLRDSDVASVKKALLQQLKSSLSQQSVFTLLALDSLAGDSPLILHSYCDHENAPFKKAFIILTVDVDASGTVGSRECNAAVYRTLADRWKTQLGFNKDKIDPFWARIGKFVICLRSQPNIEC
uniref:Torsin-1A-interacting protein 1/2 AAA+ activator domain-containing protein n=1 Tax=Plectus sambesii TaxID=2011161 RepID=A0A914XG50_9BILA